MANTLGNYNETFFAQEALIWLRNNLGFAGRVFRGMEDERNTRSRGDTIQMRRLFRVIVVGPLGLRFDARLLRRLAVRRAVLREFILLGCVLFGHGTVSARYQGTLLPHGLGCRPNSGVLSAGDQRAFEGREAAAADG